MKGRRLNPRRAKIHRTYDVAEIARLFGVHRNTVRSWLRAGLRAIDGRRPTLVQGAELQRFHTERRAKGKRPTPAEHIYCVGCRDHRRPAGDMAEYVPITATMGDLRGICPACDAMMYRRVRLSDLSAVKGNLDVTTAVAERRLEPIPQPSLDHDSDTPSKPHAPAQP